MLLQSLLRAIAARGPKDKPYTPPTPEPTPVTVASQTQLPRDPALQAIYDEAGATDDMDPVEAFLALPLSRQMEVIERELVNLKDHERKIIQEVLSKDLDRAFIPNPGPQTQAYQSKADLLLYGGAAGGGKSALAVGLAAQEHQRSLIVRRQSVELDGLIAFSRDVLTGRGDYNKVDKEWTLNNGASIKFGGMKEADDWRSYAGRARDLIVFDEGAEFLEEQVASLLAWLRSVDEKQRTRAILASNPPRGAEGSWLVTWFAPWLEPGFGNPAAPGELRYFVRIGDEIHWIDEPEFLDNGRTKPVEINGEQYTPLSATFIPARLDDNPYLTGTTYRAQLQSLPEPLRSQLLKGDFLAGREDDAWQVIPSAWVDAAMERWQRTAKPDWGMTSLGVDVAQGGGDNTSLARRHRTWFDELKVFKGIDTKDGPSVAALVFAAMRDHCQIVIDLGGGWGGSAYDHLKHQDIAVIGVNPADGSHAKSKEGLEFRNYRAEMWWKFREALDPNGGEPVCLPPDQALKADLCSPRWLLSASGIQIEGKEDVRKRLGRSTDRADAVIQAWAHGEYREALRASGMKRQATANVGYSGAKRRR